MKVLISSASLLSSLPAWHLVGVFILMLVAGLTEGIGIVLLVQLLAVIGGGSSENLMIQGLTSGMAWMGIPSTPEGLLSAFFALVLIQTLITFVREQEGSRLQFDFVDDLRSACFGSLLSAEWRWIAPRKPAELTNLILVESSRIGLGVQSGLSLLASLVAVAAYVVAAMFIAPAMAVIVIATGGSMFLALHRLQREAYQLGKLQGIANRSLLQTLQDSIGGIKLSKILGNENHPLSLLGKTVTDFRRTQLSLIRSTSLSRAFFQLGGAALLALYVYVGVTVLAVPLPELLTLVIIFARLMPMLMGAQQKLNQVINTFPAFVEVATFLAESEAARQPDGVAGTRPLVLREAIELRNIVVNYADRGVSALDGVNLVVPAGVITTIMGPSGAGKSTLADVVMGLLIPDRGEVLVDGNPLLGSARRAWMRGIAYMPQEIFLFPGTIRENLLWAQPETDERVIHEALRRAAADFVLDLPDGLETMIGHAGNGLSGGERQRVALARALLRHPTLLILDEATSALDKPNAGRVFEAVAALRGRMTVILIGHSEAAAQIADQVVVLRKGQVGAIGSWQEVLRSSDVKGA
jgi:ATP-binding cassette subfamily C protein